ncbi:nucleotide-sugar transporter [Ceratocystis lukuohia]|uniref:Nucleotide-sugar transporter n=1 Tax=Ceratocystis lukuohia TaxID=2019550 RepID=A0ABR4MRA4_9PEZI
MLLEKPGASHRPGAPDGSFLGLPPKQATIVSVMHYSRIMKPSGDHKYFPSTAVFLNEIIKLSISLTFSLWEVSRTLAPSTPATTIFEQIYRSVFSADSWKLAIPALLYTFQNTLQYVALSNLDPVHYQILYQLKILTTAIFSVVLLGRSIALKRWLALIVLTIGVSIVSLPLNGNAQDALLFHDSSDHWFPRSVHELGQLTNGAGDAARELTRRSFEVVSSELAKRSATYEGIDDDIDTPIVMNASIGILAVVIATVLSGLASVYFEKVLKDSQPTVSVWTRNIQLSFFSLFPSLFIGIIYTDGPEIAKHGFFDGYNWTVWTVIVLQAVGGILASLCISYTDSIIKNFTTSVSIVISFVFSLWFFDIEATVPLLSGAVLVLASSWAYTLPDSKAIRRPTPLHVANLEKMMVDRLNTPRHLDPIKLNTNPMDSLDPTSGLSTSRPSSPMIGRIPSSARRGFDDHED